MHWTDVQIKANKARVIDNFMPLL